MKRLILLAARSVLALMVAALVVISARGQAVTTFATGINGPGGLAFDSSGNLYVSSYFNGTGTTVSKVTTGGVVSTFATGLSSPIGLAFDSSGNLYAANYGTGRGTGTTVSKITSSGVVSTFATGLSSPMGLAFDTSGNLYVSNYGSGTGTTISKVTPAGVVSTFATGLNVPTGLAFDTSGNLYAANYGTGNGTGTTVSKITPSGVVSTFASGLSGPYGLAFDSSGNLYVSSIQGGTIVKITSGGVVSNYVTSGLSNPFMLAFDSSGTLYAANYGASTVVKIGPPAATTTTVASAAAAYSASSQSVTLSATVTSTGGTVNAGTVTFTLLNGTTTVGTATTSSTVSSGAASVSYTIPAATAAGSYTLQAVYNAGGAFATSTGTSTLTVTTPFTFATGLSSPYLLTFDSSGNLYAANYGAGSVAKITNGGTVTTSSSSGAANPEGVIFDSSGNLYVTSLGTSSIQKVTPAGVVTTFAGGITDPRGLAFDASGNLYVAGNTAGMILKITPGGTVSTFATGLSGPFGIVFDTSGNLYVVNQNANSVSKITSGGVVSTFATGFNNPTGIAIDSSGNLYVANLGSGAISKITPAGVVSAYATGLAGALGIVVSSSGNLYVASSTTGNVTEFGSTVATITTASTPTSPMYSASSQAVSLSATVTSTGTTVNGGTVTFTLLNGSATIGTPVTSSAVSGGSASASYTLPAATAVGSYTIRAAYNGGGNFAASSDNTHSLTVSPPTFTVSSDATLRAAITNAVAGSTITFSSNITLSSNLPALTVNATINGAGFTLTGAGFSAFNISSTTTIQNLTVTGASAVGSNGSVGLAPGGAGFNPGGGGGGGGGGAGLGGALFVTSTGNVTLSGVSLNSNSAVGGNGGVGNGGAGGTGNGGAGAIGGGPNPGAAGAAPTLGGTGGNGGAGGFASGGGGGAGTGGTAPGNGGAGGFGGGGGGGGGGAPQSSGGSAGFGGGNGTAGVAMTGGSNGGTGGGGAGLGGAVFVQNAGTLTITGALTVNGNSVTGGTASSGIAGSGLGSGFFFQGNSVLTFTPGSGLTETVSDVITDPLGNGGTGSEQVLINGAGTLVLSGTDTYAGSTNVISGTVLVNGALSNSSSVVIQSGATLGGTGTIGKSVTLNSGGKVAPGNGSAIGTLSIGGNVLFSPTSGGSATMPFLLSNTASTSSLLAVTGTFSYSSAAAIQFDFQNTGAAGKTYTLATFSSTNFVASNFTYVNLPSGLTGTFTVNAGSLQFTTSSSTPPAIGTPPANSTVTAGNSATFTVAATGSGSLAYQWYFNGAAISGATNSSYSVSGAQLGNAGNYTVAVTNSAGTAISTAGVLTVNSRPTAVSGGENSTTGFIAPLAGQSFSINALATGSGTLTYQWYKNGIAISGQTNSSLSLANIQASNAADYTVKITNSAGSVTSSTIPLVVENYTNPLSGAISISTDTGTQVNGTINGTTGLLTGTVTSGGTAVAPTSATVTSQANLLVPVGSSATLVATASGNPAPTYQWYLNGTALSGQTGYTLTLSNAQTANSGQYTFKATNSGGSATSSAIGVSVGQFGNPTGPVSFATSGGTQIVGTVDSAGVLSGSVTTGAGAAVAPTIGGISSQSGLLLNQGASATLTVAASGNPAPTYQWYLGGTALSGQTSSSLTLTNVQSSNAGSYTVTATNSAGSATSAAMPVTVIQIGTGTGPISIAGGNGTSINGTVSSSGALTGSVASTASAAPQISGINDQNDLLVAIGGSATLSVVTTGSPTPTYQWYQNGTALSGQTANALTISSAAASNAGSYTVTATNSAGSVTSSPIGVTVAQIGSPSGPLSISTSGGTQIAGTVASTGVLTGSVLTSSAAAPQISGISSPSGLLLNQGSNATLTIAASGNPTPSYQWYLGTTALSGQTSAALTLINVQPTDAGSYSVTATNSAGSATSAAIPVTVIQIGSGAGPISIAGGNGTVISGTVSSSGALTGGVTSAAAAAPQISAINDQTDVLVTTGGTATLSVVATGSPLPTYQWFQNGAALSGQTGSALTISNAAASNAGSYTVQATNSAGTVTSSSIGVTVAQIGSPSGPLSIATSGGTQIAGTVGSTGVLTGSVTTSSAAAPQISGISSPSGLLLNQGANATLTVAASGNPAPGYQWYLGTTALSGQTGASLTLTNVQASNAGSYSVKATNSAGSATSAAIPVTVIQIGTGTGPISIAGGNGTAVSGTVSSSGVLTGSVASTGPAAPQISGINDQNDVLISTGGSATLSVAATGSPTPSYQWFQNGTALSGQTGSALTITNAQASNAGSYTVQATNSAGSVKSASIGVTVAQIGSPSGPLSIATSGGTQIAGTVAGNGVLTGSVTTAAAAAPQISGITSQSGLLLNQGASATLAVSAFGNPAPVFQWFLGGAALAGQTGSTLTLTNVQPSNAGSYTVTATNSAGSVVSAAVPVTVIQISSGNGPLSIAGGNGTVINGTVSSSGALTGSVTPSGAAAPKISGINDQTDLLVSTGGSATLSVVATGAPLPTYQWFQNGTALSGQTGSSLTIANAQAANAGSYTVKATNSAGSVTSSSIGVTVAQIGSPSGPLSIATSGGTLISGTVAGNGVLSGSVTPGATGGGAATPVAPQISGIGSPSGLLVSQGSTATLTIAGSGNPPPQYQWFFNGSALAGQTGTSLTLTNAQPSNAGTYTVAASNSGGKVTSSGFIVSVDQIGAGAGPITIVGGNGTLISGTVNSSGALTGSVTSAPAGATVAPLVAGVTSNSDLFLQPGDSAELTVFATGSPAPAYQWFRNGAMLAGETAAILDIVGARSTDAGQYSVTATNSAGSVTSSTVGVTVGLIASGAGPVSISTAGGTQVNATVSSTGVLSGSVAFNGGTVSQAPSVAAISGTPDSILVQTGSAISFSASAIGTPAPAYQWFKNGAALSGQTAATFTLASAQATDAGSYTVVATNSAGSSTSSPLGVSVGNIGSDGSINVATSGGTAISAGVDSGTGLLTGGINTGGTGSSLAPSISAIASTPSSVAAQQGSTATLTALATGVPAPTFQWSFNGGILPGQTGATLTLANIQPAAAGNYTVTATNTAASTTSNAVQVTVYNVGSNGAISASTNSGATIAAAVNSATGAVTGTVVNGVLPTPFSGSRLTNLSSSAFLVAGGQVTQGFVITSPKQLLVRAVGPGLAQFGYSQVLSAPTLQIQSGSTIVASNSGLGGAATVGPIAQAAQRLGAFPLAASGMDAAVITSLPAGEYTISVGSASGGGGQVLVEIYDTGSLQSSTGDVSNFSSRSNVAAGSVVSGGIVVAGTTARNLLIRAVGPTLGTAFGLGNVMPFPVLKVQGGSGLIVQNSGWSSSSNAAQIQSAAASAGAFALPAGSADSAAIVTLQPGSYTVQVSDAKGGGGTALIEVYELP